ncbi:MAG: FAD binding domain-containing protein [Deltaproteobacteria bacterium]|nr:FAD binding domain-containing protein [Deltaproteobacteria bacterium]
MYHQPRSIDEALELKARLGGDGTFLAGGTDLVVGLRKGKLEVKNLIDLSRVPGLDELQERDGHLVVGARVTHARLERCKETALAAAAETVGGPQIRNLGTVGGQIGTASPAGDVTVALLALKAEAELLSRRGRRRVPLEQVFVGPGRTSLAPDELLRAVHVPLGRRSVFYKLGKRGAVAISVVMAAASVGPGGDVALAVGCAAPVPLRIAKAEALLDQQGLTEAAIARAAELAEQAVTPITDHRGGEAYRRAMAGTLTRRLLTELAQGGHR